MNDSKKWMVVMVGGVIVAGVGAHLTSARAEGIPAVDPVVYSGLLEDSGVRVTGQVDVTVALFDAATLGTQVCSTGVVPTNVVDGHFEVALPAACVAAIRADPDLWVQIAVGTDTFPRSRVTAVPFALEADRASNAVGPLGARLTALEGARDLPAGTTLAGATIATGPHFTAADAVAALSGAGDQLVGAINSGSTSARIDAERLPAIIVCTQSWGSGTTGSNTRTFTAANCGGTLPGTGYQGAFSAMNHCGGVVTWTVLQPGSPSGPGVNFFASASCGGGNASVMFFKVQ